MTSSRKSARTDSAEPPLLGSQTPRILACPPAKTSAGAEAVELCEAVGLVLDPWQRLTLDLGLREREDHTWSSWRVGLCASRQSGKSELAIARILAGLYVFGEELVVYSAHEYATAKEIMRRTETLIANSDLASDMRRVIRSHGEEGIELHSGQRVKFKTRTKVGGRGLSAPCVILDEAMVLSEESMGALMFTVSAMPNPQLWFIGSAVDQQIHPEGRVFASVRQAGIDGTDPRLCYLEWSAEDGDDPADPHTWAKAVPGMGYRVSPEHIEAERRSLRHSPKTFLTERLCIGDWPTLAGDHEPPIPMDTWDAMTNTTPQLVGPVALGLDRSRDRQTWTLAAAQRTADGRTHVEVGYHEAATNSGAVEYIVDVIAAWKAVAVAVAIDTKSPAAVLRNPLDEADIEATMTTAADLAIACGGMYDDALQGRLSHTGQEVLTDALACAGKRDLPGGFCWTAADGAGSIAALNAVTLARWALGAFSPPPRLKPPPPLTDAGKGPRDDGQFRDWDKTPF